MNEILLNRAKETVGYLMSKAKQFKGVDNNTKRIFLERADAIEYLIKHVEGRDENNI